MLLPTDPRLHLPFDILAWAASAVLARWLYVWRLRPVADLVADQLSPAYSLSLAGGALAGGWLLGSANTMLTGVPHLSHSIAGALAGAIIAVEAYKAVAGIRGSTGIIWVGPFALGIAIGRFGCLFAGIADETFGSPTTMPWGIDLGDGVSRHPVQLYESFSMLAFLLLYLRALSRRAPWATTGAFYVLVGWYGVQRFVWEFFKPYPRLVGPLDIFQLCALGLIAYAVVYHERARRSQLAQDQPVAVLRADDQPV